MSTSNATSQPAAVEKRFFESLLGADPVALGALLTDDFVLVDVMMGSEVPRAALLDAVAKGHIRFDAIDVVESRLRTFGTTAVVTGRTTMRGRAGEQAWSVESRYTHVFVEQDGRWLLASAQGTPIRAS